MEYYFLHGRSFPYTVIDAGRGAGVLFLSNKVCGCVYSWCKCVLGSVDLLIPI